MFINEKTEKRIDELLSKMTLHEKVGQLNQVGPSPVGGFEISKEEAKKMLDSGKISEEMYQSMVDGTMVDRREDEVRQASIGSFLGIDNIDKINHLQKIAVEETRLGIPLIFGMDVIHGHKTIFPIPLAESCTFDDEAFRLSAEIAAREAAEDGIDWTFAPMVDIGRDARWGRVAEGCGEDTYLATRYSAAKVKGFQGDDISHPERVAACVKHYAAYGACEGGRDYDTVDMSLAKFFEIYFPPFEAAIKAGVATVMAAFNDFNGVPCHHNKFLLTDLLRDKLGFDGFVVSDANGVAECVNHGTAKWYDDSAKQAINAGLNMDMGSCNFITHLENLVAKGEVDEETINNAVRCVLRIKFALGLFDNPYKTKKEVSSHLCKEHRDASREIAKKSIVLLKNEDKLLPLKKDQKIAIVGEVAASKDWMHGTWCCSAVNNSGVSIIDALNSRNINYTFSDCCGEFTPYNEEELIETVKDFDTVVAVVSYHCSGEAQSMCKVRLSDNQQRMLDVLHGLGKKVVTVLINGRTFAMNDVVNASDAIVNAWHLGSEAGEAIVQVLYGEYNPTGRLTATVPYFEGQWPIYYNRANTGRPASDELWTNKYIDAPLTPLYPFGYGLSYTEYVYGETKAEVEGDTLKVSVDITNSGDVDGEETVQLYIHRKNTTRVRPTRELKGYKKIFLKAGETKTVTIEVSKQDLGYYDICVNYITSESEFDVWLSHDSATGNKTTITF